jgi:hypothetical protein
LVAVGAVLSVCLLPDCLHHRQGPAAADAVNNFRNGKVWSLLIASYEVGRWLHRALIPACRQRLQGPAKGWPDALPLPAVCHLRGGLCAGDAKVWTHAVRLLRPAGAWPAWLMLLPAWVLLDCDA